MRTNWPAAQSLRELIAQLNDDQVVTERCANCGWEHEGAFREGRAAFRVHVEQEHPGLVRALSVKRMPVALVPKQEPEFALLRRLSDLAAA